MKPSHIAQIIIRLFSISWFLQAIVQIVALLTMNVQDLRDPALFLLGIITFLIAIAAWFLAPALGMLICKGNDTAEQISTITFQQLLHAMFLGIGLFFCLSSMAGLLTGLHFFLLMKSTPESIPAEFAISQYDFITPALTFFAGGFLVGSSGYWSAKISKGK
jgi:hypothetical protein